MCSSNLDGEQDAIVFTVILSTNHNPETLINQSQVSVLFIQV